MRLSHAWPRKHATFKCSLQRGEKVSGSRAGTDSYQPVGKQLIAI